MVTLRMITDMEKGGTHMQMALSKRADGKMVPSRLITSLHPGVGHNAPPQN